MKEMRAIDVLPAPCKVDGRSHGKDASVVDFDCAGLDDPVIAVDRHDKVVADDAIDTLLQ